MNTDLDFYKWFETIAVKLGYREISFRKIFEYLDNQPTPIIIVETGSLREEGNFLSCLLYTSPSPRDRTRSRMPSSA